VAKAFEKNLFLRMGLLFMPPMIKLGVGGKGMHLLTVQDQEGGGMQTTPVTVIDDDSGRWLVAQYGVTRWVRNARAAGQIELRRGRRREKLDIAEVGPDEGAPILKKYVEKVSTSRPYFDVQQDAPPEAFASEMPKHPVFRILGSAS
jgi:F420H(2)-dependent quinone reductase